MPFQRIPNRNSDKAKNGQNELKPSDFKGIFSKEEGRKFRKYLTKIRKEWGVKV